MYSELAQLLDGFNKDATVNYYKDQLTAKENCQCEDCAYFQDVFIQKELKLFAFLTELGIDLRKDEDIDPEGLWMILDDNNEFYHCLTAHAVLGDFGELKEQDRCYEFIEGSVKILFQIHIEDEHRLILYITFDAI